MTKFGLRIAFVAALVFAVSSAATVSAVQYGGVGGKPANPEANNPRTKSIFIYQLKPGQQRTDAVRVLNNTNQTQTIAVDAVDSVLSSGGAFSCAQAADQKTDVGAWIKLQSNSVTLAAGTDQVVPFTVTIPAGAGVGEHDGCITIQAASQTARPSSRSGVVLSFRSAIRVVVTVPGKIIKKLTLTSVGISKAKDGKYLVVPTAQNDGNVSLDTDVQAGITSLFGTTAGKAGGTYPVLPRSKASWNFEVKPPFWGGWYHARVKATYNSNPTAELGIQRGASKTVQLSSVVFFAAPSAGAGTIYLLVLLGVASVAAWSIKKQRDVQHIKRHWKTYVMDEGDTLSGLAKHHGTSWRKIARVNRLKPPYNLHKNQKLRLPPPHKKHTSES